MRITSKLSHKGASRRKGLIINLHVVCTLYQYGYVCLHFTSLQQRGHLETAAHLLSLAKDVKLGKYTVPTGNEPRAVAWQSITLPLRHASSIYAGVKKSKNFHLSPGQVHQNVYLSCYQITCPCQGKINCQ